MRWDEHANKRHVAAVSCSFYPVNKLKVFRKAKDRAGSSKLKVEIYFSTLE